MTGRAQSLADERRLHMVAALVPPGSRVADIGTDHGILPLLLLKRDRSAHCIASDRARGSLDRLRGRAWSRQFADRLELRAGSGLQVLGETDRVDVVVISGLGGRSIVRILEEGRASGKSFPRLVLQPQSEPARVRRWVRLNGYAIVEERMIRERNRFYVAAAAEPLGDEPQPGHPRLTVEELDEAGPRLVGSADPLVREYWERALREQQTILRSATGGSGRREAEQRLRLAQRVLDALPAQDPTLL